MDIEDVKRELEKPKCAHVRVHRSTVAGINGVRSTVWVCGRCEETFVPAVEAAILRMENARLRAFVDEVERAVKGVVRDA